MERNNFLDDNIVNKLVHPDEEVRIVTLRHLTSILKNNINFSAKDSKFNHGELSFVSLDILVRYLIRWFGYQPIKYEDEVLDLLILIFSRRDFLRHVAKNINIKRLKKETVKIQNLVVSNESFSKLQTIHKLLTDYECSILADVTNKSGSFYESASSQHSQLSIRSESPLEKPQNKSSSVLSLQSNQTELEQADEFWEELSGANLDTFNGIDAELSLYKEENHLINVLSFINVAVEDYPAEFFFQPPNVLESLVKISSETSQIQSIRVFRLIRLIIIRLKNRWKEAIISTKKQQDTFISFRKHINNILLSLTNFFKEICENFSSDMLVSRKKWLNEMYLLLFDVAKFIKETQNVCLVFLNELMNMMGIVSKILRSNYFSGTAAHNEEIRLFYIVNLFVLNTFIDSTDSKTSLGENNLWEYECDISLLDVPLRICQPRIFALIETNRKDVIKEDKELTLLLNSQSSWKPVVKLFQDWENLSDEKILYLGLETINTIRIHRCLELVELLLKTIKKCSVNFNHNKKLKKSAEKIFIRLISNEVPEIRKRVYVSARKHIEKTIQGEIGYATEDSSLCTLLGFPLTSEIVTEIICFGYTDNNREIARNAKQILFGLLRSQLYLKDHWQLLLNIIKPILPLMTCLEDQMVLFAFDVYQQYSVFDTNELNQAYAKFLYCKHPETRKSAKRKLLENLEFDTEIIEIVPDDFCVVQMPLISELPMPDSKIGYDREAYNSAHEVLTTMDRSDESILQAVLLRLSMMMNSRELCQRTHDDNVWVYFMASLDMGFPNNVKIRKFTINILFKWAVSISNFRLYLANEPSVLKFLVRTLIEFQDETQIRKETSWLLFYLLFSDFVVATEQKVSMPKLLSTLNFPFKFEHHWTESPFNSVTLLEQLNEAMETHQEAAEVHQITQKHLKFTFSLEWFKDRRELLFEPNFNSSMYYLHQSPGALRVPERFQLTGSDISCFKQTCSKQILETICCKLENTTVVQEALSLSLQVRFLLMLPTDSRKELAATLSRYISRFTVFAPFESEQMLFKSFIQIYRDILDSLDDESIVRVFNNNLIKGIIKSNINFPVKEEVHVEVMDFMNCVIKTASKKPNLMELLLKNFEREEKIHLPSRIVESSVDQLFEKVMQDRKWHQIVKRPVAKSILVVLHSTLEMMPLQLDHIYLNGLFDRLLTVTKPLYRSHLNQLKLSTPLHVHSKVMQYIFAILLSIASKVKHLKLTPENYKSFSMWTMQESLKIKTLPWLTLAQLTKDKEDYAIFRQNLFEHAHINLNEAVLSFLLKPVNQLHQALSLQQALVTVLANILENDVLSGKDLISVTMVIDKLLACRNLEALAFLIRKMLQIEFPNLVQLVEERRLIHRFLEFDKAALKNVADYQSVAYLLETVVFCFNHEPLAKHVSEILLHDSSFVVTFIELKRCDLDVFKRFNNNVFNLMMIMMKTEAGLRKISQVLQDPKVANRMMLASHENLKINHPFSMLVFQLRFWYSLLDAASTHGSPVFDLISTHSVDSVVDDIKKCTEFVTVFEKKCKSARFVIDLLFLHVVSIFDFSYSSKHCVDYKIDIKSLCFIIIKKLISNNTRVKELATEIDLFSILKDKLQMILTLMESNRHFEATKKHGAQRCQTMIKDLCLFLKAFTEWQLSLDVHTADLKQIFKELLKVFDWLNADSVLMNCFIKLLQSLSILEIGRSCIMEKVGEKPLVEIILKKVQAISEKPPHTEMNMALIKNIISTLKICSHFVEVRVMLKNSKIYQMLETLHPQIHKTRKSSWDQVTIEWLEFFEYWSRFEDSECLPNRISLLCRLHRLGNSAIQKLSLVIIRNFSLKASIGHVLVNSDDFKHTVDAVLLEPCDSHEKILVLETLMSVASKTEQLKSKLKNSSLNRKLKEQLRIMQSDAQFQSNPENVKILHLTSMLSLYLYPEN